MNNKITIDDAFKIADLDNTLLKRRENGFLLSNYQISVLERNEIHYNNYGNIKSLLFDIEDILNENYDEELDLVSSQLAEFAYYKYTEKWEDKFYFSFYISFFFIWLYILGYRVGVFFILFTV